MRLQVQGLLLVAKNASFNCINVRQTSMRYRHTIIGASFLFSVSVGVATAEESNDADEYHPFLSSKLNVGVGLLMPTNKNSVGAESPSVGVQDSIDTSETQTTGILNARWRYTENWSFQVNHWKTSSDSRETLTQKFTFQDEVFEAG
jgi:hypothetical protein